MDYKAFLARAKKRRLKIAGLLAQGMSLSEVARKMGVSRQRVSQIANPAK